VPQSGRFPCKSAVPGSAPALPSMPPNPDVEAALELSDGDQAQAPLAAGVGKNGSRAACSPPGAQPLDSPVHTDPAASQIPVSSAPHGRVKSPLFAMLLAPGWLDARIDRCQVVRSRKRPGLSRSAGSRRRSSLSLPSEPHRLRRRRSRLGRSLSPSGRWANHGVASPQPRRQRSMRAPRAHQRPCRQRAGTPHPGVERGLEPHPDYSGSACLSGS
jgi:hypothetical protein